MVKHLMKNYTIPALAFNKNHNEKGKKINLSIDFFGYEVHYFIHTYQRKNLLHKLAYYNK